jgi:uncharacterized protein
MLAAIAHFILEKKYYLLAVIGLLTVYFTFLGLRINVNRTPEELIFQNDPEYPLLRAFFHEFGYDEIVVAAYVADNVLTKRSLETIEKIRAELLRVHGIVKVLTLTNAEDVVDEDGSLKIVPLVRRLPESSSEQEDLRRRIEENPIYRKLLISEDATVALFDIVVRTDFANKQRLATMNSLREIFRNNLDNPAGTYHLSGSPVARDEMFRMLMRDFGTLVPLSLLLLIVSMYLMFRDYLCILLPVVAVSLGVVWTVGFINLAGSELNVLPTLIPTILFIAGASDCIHIISQYQDCRYSCSTKQEALRETTRLMVLPSLLTAFSTVLCLFSLGAANIRPVTEFGVFCGVGIAFVCLLAITLIPIGLSIADTKSLTRKKPPSEAFVSLLDRIMRTDEQHKALFVLVSIVLTAVSLYGMTKLQVETDAIHFAGKRFRGVSDTLFIEEKLGGVIPLYVVVDTGKEDGLKDPEVLRDIDALGEYIRRQDGVDKVISVADVVKHMNAKLNGGEPPEKQIPQDPGQIAELLLLASFSENTEILSNIFDDRYSKTAVAIRFRYHDFFRIERFNSTIRTYLDNHFNRDAQPTAYTTGTAILCANTLVPILQGMKQSLILSSVALFFLMTLLYRSLRIGLVSMIPNIVPVLMTLGAMGLLGIPLNFASAPIGAMALGIAIDDTIHLLSRFKLELAIDQDYPAALRRTIRSVGKPIVLASIILITGFSILLFSNFQFTRNLGVLVSFTFVSAIVAELFLTPPLLLIFKPIKIKGKMPER